MSRVNLVLMTFLTTFLFCYFCIEKNDWDVFVLE